MGRTDNPPLRILLGKLGLDGHTRGVKAVAGLLRDAGMEIIYSGLRRTPREVADIALQEDVDAIGLSFMAGAHLELTEDLLAILRNSGAAEVPVVVGGVIPDRDVQPLLGLGVQAVFQTGATGSEIIACFRTIARRSVT